MTTINLRLQVWGLQTMRCEIVPLDSLMDLDAAEALRLSLAEAFLAGRDVELDASRVTQMTFGAVQVMLAALQQSDAAGVQIRIAHEPAPVVQRSFASAGFDIAALATTSLSRN